MNPEFNRIFLFSGYYFFNNFFFQFHNIIYLFIIIIYLEIKHNITFEFLFFNKC